MNTKIESVRSVIEKTDSIFIVNSSTSFLDKITDELVSNNLVFDRIQLNKALSKFLISEPRQSNSSKAIEWFKAKANEGKGLLLLCEIDILFEPSLEIDPLALFKQISRHKKIIVLWPGSYSNNTLAYATPDHAHFKRWVNPGVEIIQL